MLRGVALLISLYFSPLLISALDEVDSLRILAAMRRCAQPMLPETLAYPGFPEKRISAKTHHHIVKTHFLVHKTLAEFIEDMIPARIEAHHQHHIRRTTLFSAAIHPQEVFDKLPQPLFFEGEPRFWDSESKVASFEMEMELKGQKYKIRVGKCMTDDCKGYSRGEMVNLYPICGPEVILIEHWNLYRARSVGKTYAPIHGVPCP